MKAWFGLLLLIFVPACKEERKNKKPEITAVPKDSLQEAENDNYFMVYTPLFLQKDILYDSAEYVRKDSCVEISIRLPKRTRGNAVIYKKIADIRKKAMQDFRRENKDGTGPCIYEEQEHIWLEPMHLFQTKKFISYIIRNSSGMTGGTTGFYNYVINYDLEEKKEIELDDFFRLKTHNDSLYINQIISRSIGEEEKFKSSKHEYERMFFLESNFAFDSTNVYFFFERYGIVGWGGQISVIRKKYLTAFINPRYQ
jgi:hypothetical protein